MSKYALISFLVIFTSAFALHAEAQELGVFSEDFGSDTDNWNLESGWSVISEDGNRVLQGTEHTFATPYLEGVANKLELKVKLLQRTIQFSIRSKPVEGGFNRYFIGLHKDGSYVQKQLGNDFQTLKSGKGISVNEWRKIKVEVVQNRIEVFSDGDLVLSAQDNDVLKEGGVNFEALENSQAYIDDVRVETSVPEERKLNAQELFQNGEHKGDLTLEGRDYLVLEGGKFEQFGNIYLKGSSRLVVRDSILKVSRYQRLLNHWGIYLKDSASLEVESSELVPGEETLFIIYANDRSKVTVRNSPTKLHLFTMFGRARGLVENSTIVGEIGGLVGAFDRGNVKVVNSKIGAVNLHIPPGATFEASGLGTGFFEKWNLHENAKVSGINYNITLIGTELVKDTIGPGPFERGWPVFIESDAHVKIKDSELRKVVVTLRDEKAEFSNFSLETQTNFNYRDIKLENVIVKGQWGIFIHGSSDVVVRDSDAFWTFIFDESKLRLINTHMNEFDPRDFHGEIIFENSRWDTAAEILENNNFTMSGGLEIGNIGGFSWENSKVTRIYDLVGKPNSELTLRKDGEIVWQGKTDDTGMASFSLKFDDATFDDSWLIQDNFGNENEVTFFSKTPINIQQNIISKSVQKIKAEISSGPPPASVRTGIVVFAIITLAVIIFFFGRKYFKKR